MTVVALVAFIAGVAETVQNWVRNRTLEPEALLLGGVFLLSVSILMILFRWRRPPSIEGSWKYDCTTDESHGSINFCHGGTCDISLHRTHIGYRVVVTGTREWEAKDAGGSRTNVPEQLWVSDHGALTGEGTLLYTYTAANVKGWSRLTLNSREDTFIGRFVAVSDDSFSKGTVRLTRS